MMSAATAVLTSALVDDAGLFPPEELDLRAALTRHRVDQAAGSPVLSHRFVCPADRVPELQRALHPADRISLSVLVAPTARAITDLRRLVNADARLELAAVEGRPSPPPRGDAAPAGLPSDLPGFLEVPLGPGLEADLDRLAQQGWAAKVRCGGVRAEAFPSPEALAAFLRAAVSRGVAFKATAGLHHAVSHHDAFTGFAHYGFLNLLLAVHRTQESASAAEVAEVLVSRDAAAVAEEARGLTERAAGRVRQSFRSYGSCSTSEPLADLVELGLLPHPGMDPARPERLSHA